MVRFSMRLVCALSACLGCAQDLRCYEGAVEINDVCECPSGTTYVRALDACIVPGLADGGATDASVSPIEGSELDASPRLRDARAAPQDARTSARDARVSGSDTGDTSEDPVGTLPPGDASASGGASCAASWLLCGDTCVDPRSDSQHCGGCAPCKAGSICQVGACVDVGCSDGTREAFLDLAKFPDIAGCAATWPVSSMRAPRKLPRCGNSAAACEAPLDACAEGWHVCGNTEGNATDITSRIGQADCSAQKGRFAGALGDQSCTPCTELGAGAVCCGDGCIQQQGSCLWPMATAWFGVRDGVAALCGKLDNPIVSDQLGVMCCRDGK
jgi:hypothetical protein